MAWLALMQELTYIGHVFNTFLIGYNISESLFLQAKGKSQVWLLKLCCHLPGQRSCSALLLAWTGRVAEHLSVAVCAASRRAVGRPCFHFPVPAPALLRPPSPSVRCVSSLITPLATRSHFHSPSGSRRLGSGSTRVSCLYIPKA